MMDENGLPGGMWRSSSLFGQTPNSTLRQRVRVRVRAKVRAKANPKDRV
jgi:hypothetical protein